MKKAAEFFVEILESEGVKYMFGVPGEENLDLLDAIRVSSIKFITCRDERTAGFMAATMGRLTGSVGVVLSTLGPGATNLVTPAAYATLGGMPLLLITGQKPVKTSKQGHFQIVDVVDVMSPVTKFARQIISASQIHTTVIGAIRSAEEERPGAVHLELPEDVAREETNEILSNEKPLPTRRPLAETKAIMRASEMLINSKHPLILVGAGANRKLVAKMLRELVAKTRIPVICTQMGKGVFDERDEHFLGTTALSSGDYVHCAIEKADCILNIGHDVIEKPPFVMRAGDTRKVIHINFYTATLDPVYFPSLEVIGDIANALWQIKEALPERSSWDQAYFEPVRTALITHEKELLAGRETALIPISIVETVRKCLPESGILALDNGMYKLWFARHYKTYAPKTLLLDNALATMGAGISAAMSAKLNSPSTPVIALVGDGGLLMSLGELETAKREGLHFPIIILKDNGFGMIKWKQDSMGLPSFGLDLQNPDFVKIAEAFGGKGTRVSTSPLLADAIKEALLSDTITFIEVSIDYADNTRVFTNHIKNLTCPI